MHEVRRNNVGRIRGDGIHALLVGRNPSENRYVLARILNTGINILKRKEKEEKEKEKE